MGNDGGWLHRCSIGWLPGAYLRHLPLYYRGVDPVIDHDRGNNAGILGHSFAEPQLPPTCGVVLPTARCRSIPTRSTAPTGRRPRDPRRRTRRDDSSTVAPAEPSPARRCTARTGGATRTATKEIAPLTSVTARSSSLCLI